MYISEKVLSWINNNPLMVLLLWLMFLDVILGTVRAILEKSFNSSVGKKGLITKVAILVAAISSVFVDYAVDINFLSIIPESISNAIGIGEPGLCETVIILFSIYEAVSVVKNWSKLDLPGSKKLESILGKFTNELS